MIFMASQVCCRWNWNKVEELYLLRRSEPAWTQCYVGAEVAVFLAPVLSQGLANSCTLPSCPASSVVLLLHIALRLEEGFMVDSSCNQ